MLNHAEWRKWKASQCSGQQPSFWVPRWFPHNICYFSCEMSRIKLQGVCLEFSGMRYNRIKWHFIRWCALMAIFSEMTSNTSRLTISVYRVCEEKIYFVPLMYGAEYIVQSRRCLSYHIRDHCNEGSSLNKASFHSNVLHTRQCQVCILSFNLTCVIGGHQKH